MEGQKTYAACAVKLIFKYRNLTFLAQVKARIFQAKK
jgi:hypothetical protein